MGALAAGDGPMIGRIKSWFTPEARAAEEQRGYIDQLLSAQLANATGTGSVRDSGVYEACRHLIADCAATAELEGDGADILQPRLGEIASSMVDTGQSAHEMIVGRAGRLGMLPVEITNVQGGAEEESWIYTLARAGPLATMTAIREQAGVLNFRLRPSLKTPWRGTPSLQAGNTTAALLRKLEVQLTSEAAFKPARILGAGLSKQQRSDVAKGIEAAGIVVFPVMRGGHDSKPIHTGSVGGEYTTAGVELHGKLNELVCSVMGVPADLIVGSGSSVSARESYRRLASATIFPLLQTIMQEWSRKVGPMTFDLSALRASDQVGISRALGSRANAVSKLVASGVPLDQALDLAGID